jgi:hypothetical protein
MPQPLTQAQGDFTIVDFNDAPMLQALIDKTAGNPYQIYKADSATYNAGNSWDTTKDAGVNLVLLPRLYVSGLPPVEVCADAGKTVTVNWYHDNSGSFVLINSSQTVLADATNFAFVNTSARYGIKITKNFLGVATKSAKLKAEITYTDPISTLQSTSVAMFDLNVLAAQKGAVALILTSNNGLSFKNGALNQTDSLILTATLMRGSTEDTTNLTYVWKQDGVTIAGATTKNLTVTAGQVYGNSVFACTVTDSVELDNYTNTVMITDLMDNVDVNITSDVGDKFKANTTITATLTARLYQSGQPITAPAGAGFLWSLLNSAGAATDWITGTDNTPTQGAYTTGSLTGAGAINTNFITGLTLTNIRVGQSVTGTGVPAGSRVAKIDTVIVPNRVYITENLTAAGTSYTFALANNERLTTTNTTTVSDTDITVRGTILAKVFM